LKNNFETIEDFGFTAVSEDDLESIQAAESNAQDSESRLKQLYDAIMPLLKNLKQNAAKDYIYWPNRVEKVELFENKIKEIMRL
jgi:hypothetical protein